MGTRLSAMTKEEVTAHLTRLRAIMDENRRSRLRFEPRDGADHVGFIYIQSHPVLPGLLKIGIASVLDFEQITETNITKCGQYLRLRKAVPVFGCLKKTGIEISRAIKQFHDVDNRGFFRLHYGQAVLIIESALEILGRLKDEVKIEDENIRRIVGPNETM